eukprot:gnl/Hemi2/5071_TR1763_c0_g1_i1.p1 gnl/Hemi2/5071_TR1763_c0_g1~~gnl/Hemi2/5071_TR1763_c0_g1_i1.p1  ORF type:complete len:564 (+),score=159.30 gnl/Hemi2/5071_TR1763_c0_g1_i1:114-1805(+)
MGRYFRYFLAVALLAVAVVAMERQPGSQTFSADDDSDISSVLSEGDLDLSLKKAKGADLITARRTKMLVDAGGGPNSFQVGRETVVLSERRGSPSASVDERMLRELRQLERQEETPHHAVVFELTLPADRPPTVIELARHVICKDIFEQINWAVPHNKNRPEQARLAAKWTWQEAVLKGVTAYRRDAMFVVRAFEAGLLDEMRVSFCTPSNPLQGKENIAKGGSYFFKTSDDRFLIKSVHNSYILGEEKQHLMDWMDELTVDWVQQEHACIIVPIYGVYKLSDDNYIMVIKNVMPRGTPKFYDIKGYPREGPGKDQDYLTAYPKGLFLPVQGYENMLRALSQDIKLLLSKSAVDYSLLVAVRPLEEGEEEFGSDSVALKNPTTYSRAAREFYAVDFNVSPPKTVAVSIGIIDYLQNIEILSKKSFNKALNKLKGGENSVIATPEYAGRLFHFVANQVFHPVDLVNIHENLSLLQPMDAHVPPFVEEMFPERKIYSSPDIIRFLQVYKAFAKVYALERRTSEANADVLEAILVQKEMHAPSGLGAKLNEKVRRSRRRDSAVWVV